MMNKMMKKLAVVLTVAAMSLTAVPATVSANDGMGIDTMSGVSVRGLDEQMFVVGDYGANVRTAPSTDYRVIKTLSKGSEVWVTGRTSNGWCQVNVTDPVYGGTTAGYISEGLLDYTMNGQDEEAAGGYYTVDVNTFLSLRNGPSSDYEEIGRLADGSEVVAIGQSSNGFLPVAVNYAANGSTGNVEGRCGYVYMAYLN